jgi:hypothetical protein
LNACTNSAQIKAENAVKAYLKDNLNNPDSYSPYSFSKIKSVKKDGTICYCITHVYTLLNSNKDRMKMTVHFILYKDFTVQDKDFLTINGDYELLEIIKQ